MEKLKFNKFQKKFAKAFFLSLEVFIINVEKYISIIIFLIIIKNSFTH